MRQGDGPGSIVREAHDHPPVPMSASRRKPLTNGAKLGAVTEDFERCYRAVKSRDTRFDGWFFTGVTSTHIYCRPSCPAITPQRGNVRFHPTAASAQQAGFRACMRCRPDASPGSPEWDMRADVAARAMKLIADGIVDREGVAGFARHLGFSVRQVQRVLVAEVGTGPLALARAQRAQTARVLMETTDLPVSHVAFAAGFASVRQFNETIREIFANTPTEIRRQSKVRGDAGAGAIQLRLPYRAPFDAGSLFAFLGMRAVPGVEAYVDGTFLRSLNLPHGEGIVELTPDVGCVRSTFYLQDLRDLTAAVTRCRRLLDLDADPVAIDETLSLDPLLSRSVRHTPGKRMPGAVDGAELAVRAVIGQQVSVAGARTVTGRLVAVAGRPLVNPRSPLTHLFPTSFTTAEAGAVPAVTIPIQIEALNLQGTLGSCTVTITLAPTPASTGTMMINVTSATGGTFYSKLTVNYIAMFTPAATCPPKMTGNYTMSQQGGTWSTTPLPNEYLVVKPYPNVLANEHTGLPAGIVDFYIGGTGTEAGETIRHVVCEAAKAAGQPCP